MNMIHRFRIKQNKHIWIGAGCIFLIALSSKQLLWQKISSEVNYKLNPVLYIFFLQIKFILEDSNI